MRQGNGSELLGMNDPRSQSIGIIYVSPNDDRKSVLAAILTQEKLGRKQVAVALPTQQNKAFQRPVDFDDLKSMRRKLQAQIIFIATPGPGPAEFARQRRFTVYSSLESYKRALQEEKELPGGEKKGLFGKGRSLKGGTALSADKAANGREPSAASGLPSPAQSRKTQEEEKEDSVPPVVPFVVGGVAGAAAARAMNNTSQKPSAGTPGTEGNTGVFSLPEDDYDDEGDALAPPPSSSTTSQKSMFTSAGREKQQPVDRAQTAEEDDDNVDGPMPIELPVRRARTTVQLDPKTLDAPAPARASKGRNSGLLAAGAVGAAGVAGAAGAAGLASQRAASGANPPPVRHTSGSSGPTGPRRRRGRGWLIALLLLLLTLLVVGGVMAYFPGTRDVLTHALPTGQAAATVNITPANQLLADSYVITGVPNNPDAARLQISARTLTKTDQQQKTVTASGHNLTKGAIATGRLTFSNGSFSPFTVAAGTSFKKANGVVVVTNTSLVIPAATPGGATGNAAVAAHATTVGTAGNLPAQSINGSCCSNGNFIFVVNNAAFAGGQDPKDYRFVQQSDVDAVVTPLKQPLVQQAWGDVQKQVASGEQMMSGAQCVSSFNTDQQVGDRGVNVPQATVTVAVKCTANVYNRQQMLALVKAQLQKKADTNVGPGYALVGNVQTTLKPQTPKDDMVSFIVDAKGVWVYQFTDAQKQALAKEIAGKKLKDATTLLQGQKGISKVQINGGDTLPTDPGQIAIQVQSITGLPGSANPPPVTPTVLNSGPGTGGATAVPGNGSIGTLVITSAFAPSRRVFGFIL